MATTYVLELLKTSKWFPLLSQNTDKMNRLISALVAFFSAVGISATMTGHLSFATGATITLGIPSLSVIFDTLLHTVGQLGIQQFTYVGLVKKPQPVMSLNIATGEPSVSVPMQRPDPVKVV